MAGEDLLEGGDGGSGAPAGDGKKKHKPLSKGQKIGVVIGAITILLVLVQIERSKAAAGTSTAASSTPIDPQTGYPEGSAQDQAALSQLSSSAGGGLGSGGGGYYSSPSPSTSTTDPFQGTDPSTGLSYASEIDSNTSGISTLQQEWSSEFSTLSTEITGISTTQTQPVSSPPPAGSTPGAPTAAQSATLAKLNQELGKDEAAKKPNTAAIATLKKQIAAVTKRS